MSCGPSSVLGSNLDFGADNTRTGTGQQAAALPTLDLAGPMHRKLPTAETSTFVRGFPAEPCADDVESAASFESKQSRIRFQNLDQGDLSVVQ